MKEAQKNGTPGVHLPAQASPEYYNQRPGRGRGDWPGTHPASDGDDRGVTDKMAAMFDRLRDAAAEHDSDDDFVPPLLHDDTDTSDQPKGCAAN
jgi:hypothetical protein